MTEDPTPDLAALTLETCRGHVGESFVRPNDAGPDITLELTAAEPGRRDPRAGDDTGRPFSLIFRGPLDPQLTQGMHDLDHPRLALCGIFLVPVGQDEDGLLYEAVFT